jgi:hypothetical protein
VDIRPIVVEVAAATDLESAVAEGARRGQALFVQNDRLFFDNRNEIARAALRRALRLSWRGKEFLEAGGLVSNTFSVVELRRRWCGLYRQDPPRPKTFRSAYRAADSIRAWDQPQDSEGARNRRSAIAAIASRRGDPMKHRRHHRRWPE